MKQPKSSSPSEEQQILSYLLGQLSPEETQRVEKRYFEDPGYLSRIDEV